MTKDEIVKHGWPNGPYETDLTPITFRLARANKHRIVDRVTGKAVEGIDLVGGNFKYRQYGVVVTERAAWFKVLTV